jgi:hypothetical protein
MRIKEVTIATRSLSVWSCEFIPSSFESAALRREIAVSIGVGIGGFAGSIGVGIGDFCGRDVVGSDGQRTFIGVGNDRGGAADRWDRRFLWTQRGAKRSWRRRRRVGIGGFCGRIGVGIGGRWTINGVRNDRGGAARSAGLRDVGGRAGRHRQRGGGKYIERWGDSGQPLPRYDPWWHHDGPSRALVAPRWAIAGRDGTPHPHHAPWWQLASPLGSYRGRGCPESPHRAWWSSKRHWRCRPARPPTPRDPTLRAAPPRSFRTPLIVH